MFNVQRYAHNVKEPALGLSFACGKNTCTPSVNAGL